jgi:hypothetical protein
MIAELKATEEKLEANQGRTECKMNARLGGTKACLEGMAFIQEKFEATDPETSTEGKEAVRNH